MNVDLKHVTEVSGEYKLRVTKPDGSVQETDWMKNLVLNTGLDYLGACDGYVVGNAFVGTGTSTPLAGQTQLDGQLATISGGSQPTSSVSSGAPAYERLLTYTFTFAQGSVVGNITEIGVGPNADGTNLFSRARIVDGGGSPISLAVVALDQLTVFYRLKVKPPIVDRTGSFVIGSTTYNYTARLASADNFASSGAILYPGGVFSSPYIVYACGADSVLDAITGSASDGISGGGSASFTASPYVPGSYQRQCRAIWGYAQGNSDNGGIKGFNVYFDSNGASIAFQYSLNVPIPKTDTQELQLNFVYAWARG